MLSPKPRGSPQPVAGDLVQQLKNQVRQKLFDAFDLQRMGSEPTSADKQRVREKLEQLLAQASKGHPEYSLTAEQRDRVVMELLDEVLGLGPLETFMNDPSVTEIIVNGPREIYLERNGQIKRVDAVFRHPDQLLYVIERILAPLGRRVTHAEPYVDARLPDGSRINVSVAPIAVDGPYVTIRKFSREVFSLEQLVRRGALTEQAADFLRCCVQARMNIVMSGASSSGKTTMLNVLADLIAPEERVVIIEDTVELQVRRPNAVRLSARAPNLEGRGELTIRHLLKNALHMRPDRIIVGEVRGEEALDMLQAMNTGHDGSMTTLHASHPLDVLDRVETMALMSPLKIGEAAVERQIRSALDLIVHVQRWPDGTRRVTHISAMRKKPRTGEEALVDLFRLERTSAAGALAFTGVPSEVLERFREWKVTIPAYLIPT